MTLSSQCARNLHKNCGRKMWSGRVCECECHAPIRKANIESIDKLSQAMAKRIKDQSSGVK